MYDGWCGQIDFYHWCRQVNLRFDHKLGTHDWSKRVKISLMVFESSTHACCTRRRDDCSPSSRRRHTRTWHPVSSTAISTQRACGRVTQRWRSFSSFCRGMMSSCTSPRQTSVTIHRRVVPGCFWRKAASACAPPRHARSSASSAIDRTGARCLSVVPRPGASALHLTCSPCTTHCCDVAWVPPVRGTSGAAGGEWKVGVDDSVHNCVCFHLAQTQQVRLSRKESSVVWC